MSARRFRSPIKTGPRPRCTSTRSTCLVSCQGNIAVGFEYAGATGRQLSLGGSEDNVALNINQLDPQFLSLGSALNDPVPNPFFGLPVGFNVTSPTISRAQSLRPFPQYGNILMGGSTLGKSQYHAAIFKVEKRVSNGWGGRINYTYSRLEDNQFGETNFFSRNSGFIQNAYDLEAEYAVGLLDVPHKIVMSPIFELPFGAGSTMGAIAASPPPFSATGRSRRSSRSRAAFRLPFRTTPTGCRAASSRCSG